MRRIVSPLALMLAALAIPGLAARSAGASAGVSAGASVGASVGAAAAPAAIASGTRLWVSRYGAPANDNRGSAPGASLVKFSTSVTLESRWPVTT